MDAASLKRHTSSKTRACKSCNKNFNVKGLHSHEKSCLKKTEARKKDRAFEKTLRAKAKEKANDNSASNIHEINGEETREVNCAETGYGKKFPRLAPLSEAGFDSRTQVEDDLVGPNENGTENDDGLRVDDIRTEYHQHSGLPSEISHFEDYKPRNQDLSNLLEEEPWLPFRTRGDFEFAELAFDAALSDSQTEKLIKIINKATRGELQFTLSSGKELRETWERASQRLTPFEKKTFSCPYKDETRDFDMHYRPLWDYTLDLMKDEQIGPLFVWDAQRLSKYDGHSFVRFYHEPWTGDRFWEIQSSLGSDGSPLAYIIYCDKANLSLFGTQKGYPVVARIANLPVEIRNGEGIGGGRVVGWLPTEFEDPEEDGKQPYTQFKRVVWHDAMGILLESIKGLSQVGFWFKCFDGRMRRIFPCIMILSADYEEQCVMALIRGLGGKAPCPNCLVPTMMLHDLSVVHELRDEMTSKADIDLRKYNSASAREEKLVELGLRPVHNVFWTVRNSDPHRSLSWDRLHAYHGGLFGHHLWKAAKKEAHALGRWAEGQLNEQFDLIPRWRNLYHSNKVMSVTFTDGSKLEDISKQLLYAAHNVLEASESGYSLLRCIRSFLVLDTYLSFEVHTSETLAAGEEELLNFSCLVQEYNESHDNFSYWDFIKMHSHRHAFDDIRAKGVTRNYNTKTNEKLHGPIKDSYHLRTNFKDIAKQILRADHICFISVLIRSRIDELDKHHEDNLEDADDGEVAKSSTAASFPPALSLHYTFGAARKLISLQDIEVQNINDIAFKDFQQKLSEFLTDFLPVFGVNVPSNVQYPIKLYSHEKITPYCFLKVRYESKVTWRMETDYLRCNPKFHGSPRYDFVIIQTVGRLIFARLIYIFSYTIGKTKYPLALVQPFDAPVEPQPKDEDFGLFRVRSQPREFSEIFPVGLIIRGSLLVKDFDTEDNYLVVDVIDSDMFLRMKEMWL